MTDAEPVVFLICDNSKTRRQFATRLKLLGYEAQLYNSADEFHKRSFATDAGCVLVFLTDPDGELHWLKEAGPCDGHWPVVAVAADADVETAVRAMKNGAFDFLLESCADRRLEAAIAEAFRRDAICRRQTASVQSIRRRMEQLPTPLRGARPAFEGQVEPRNRRRAELERTRDRRPSRQAHASDESPIAGIAGASGTVGRWRSGETGMRRSAGEVKWPSPTLTLSQRARGHGYSTAARGPPSRTPRLP